MSRSKPAVRHGRAGQLLLRSRRLTDALAKRDLLLVQRKKTVLVRRPKLIARAGITDLVDVGANAGQWARQVRDYGYRGAIWSFEPLSSAFAQLAAAAAGDPLWHVRQTAVGAEQEQLTINVSQNTLFSSFAPMRDAGVKATPNHASEYVKTEVVPVDTLDHLTEGIDGRIGVKIDVQGFESHVMDGGEQTLSRADYLEVELSLVPCYEGEPLYLEMLDRIRGYGFELALVEPVWMDHRTGAALQFNGLFLRGHPSASD